MFGSILPLMRLAGLGRKRRRGGRKRVGRHRVKRYGGRKMRMMIQGSGRRRMHGRGFFDTLKNLGSKALGLARSVPIISTGLNLAGRKDWGDAAKSIGLGRRRHHRRHYGGRMSVYGGRRRVRRRRYHRRRVGTRVGTGGRRRRYRRTRRGGKHRATTRRFSLFGGRKRKMHGRGVLSGLLGALLGGRKRTYRMGLVSRRR